MARGYFSGSVELWEEGYVHDGGDDGTVHGVLCTTASVTACRLCVLELALVRSNQALA